jgi:serine/threonine protein kinase
MALTGKGQILGTLPYMSPEQINGQEAGPTSDIFSFGLVLYEMLTGKRAFDGATPASVIAAVLERPAPSVADVAPPALDRVLKRCLEKDPENRWQSARDLKAEMEWITSAPEPERTTPSGSRRRRWIGIAAVATVITVGLGVGWWRSAHPGDPPLKPLVRLDVDLGPDVSLGSPAGTDVILSPDGTRFGVRVPGKTLFS